MVSVQLSNSSPSVDALVVAIVNEDDRPAGVPFEALGFTGEANQTVKVPATEDQKATIVVYVGLKADADAEAQRRAVAAGLKAAGKARKVALDFSALEEVDLGALAEAAVLTAYRFDTYKKPKKKEDGPGLEKVTIVTDQAKRAAAKTAVTNAITIAEAVNSARDWVNTPPADLRPPVFAKQIADSVADGVKVTVWDEKRLEKEKCGGILGVGRGSEMPPRLVKLEWAPKGAKTHIALVGKGITFDSGGLSIKPGNSMVTMKCDMAGAAAVVAATNAIARLNLPIKVTAFASLAENMPSGTATRPGDVLKMRNGATVEVHNTDAEGRLVLGDALALATELEPDQLIDVATLTGAAMVALGTQTSAILGNDDDLEEDLFDASKQAGESMWRLPIPEEMKEIVTSSSLADLRQHNPKPYGGTLFAAAFLREFVGETRWAHLDIAGPAFNEGSAQHYTPVGGTGAAVRTLVAHANALS